MDAFEIATGPWNFGGNPNPFTTLAIAEYERLLGLGHKIAAVGSSDSHEAGVVSGGLEAPDRAGHHRRACPRAVRGTASAAACRRATPT